jgi:tripeptide aminopeptidase
MDTVGTDQGIVPLKGDDGVIRTDGTTILGADDKSGIAACLELLALLRSHSVGEESGLVGAHHLDVTGLAAGHGFVLDTAGVRGSVTYWAPTSVEVTVTFHGRKAHAGIEPEKGINAMTAAAQAVAAMPLGRIEEGTVSNIGTIVGGKARNVVPATVVLEGEARSHDQTKLERQVQAMRGASERSAAQNGASIEFHTEEPHRTYRLAEDADSHREAAAVIRSLELEVIPRNSAVAPTATCSMPRAYHASDFPPGWSLANVLTAEA